MASRHRSGALTGLALAVVALIFCNACTRPARVVLYEQRQQMAQRGDRDVRAPVPSAKPLSAPASRAPARMPPASSHTAPPAAVGVSELPPPPPRAPAPPGTGAPPAASPEPAPDAQRAANTAPGATTARSFEKTADASAQYRDRPTDGIHVVTPKQTVYALSRLYGVPVRSLLVLNKLDPPYLLHTGQKIRIPVQRTHVVSKGETVYAISRRYDVSLTELVRLNDVPKPFTIVTGQTLLLPAEQRTEVATATPTVATDASSEPGAEASGDAEEPDDGEQVAALSPPAAKRVVLPPSTNIPQPKSLSRSGFLWPVNGKIISRYGAKGKGLHNDGINIAAPPGTPIRAAQNGVVAYRGNELRGFGNLILIKHDKGYMTAYAHASHILVSRGARVTRGQVIGKVGSTGSVAGSQLHFEIRRGRQPVDPLRYLKQQRADADGRQSDRDG